MKYLTGLARSRVMQLWNAGNDTASIAKLLCIQESLVANTLSHQREREHEKKKRSAA